MEYLPFTRIKAMEVKQYLLCLYLFFGVDDHNELLRYIYIYIYSTLPREVASCIDHILYVLYVAWNLILNSLAKTHIHTINPLQFIYY